MLFSQIGGPQAAGFLGGMCCMLVVFAVVGTLIGSLFFLLACFLYNKLAGGRNAIAAVPAPSFGKASGVVVVAMVVYFVMAIIGQLFAGAVGDPRFAPMLAMMIVLPALVFSTAGMSTAVLPTSFGRAMLVTLLFFSLATVCMVGLVLLLALAFAGSMGFW